MSHPICPHQEQCSGCDWLGEPYKHQLERLRAGLQEELDLVGISLASEIEGNVSIHSAGEAGLRDRVDLTWQRQKDGRLALGLYHRNVRGQIVDIHQCLQMSEALAEWFHVFRQDPPPGIQKGSVRLRVGPDGRRGAWLDLAHTDVKALLDEDKWLRRLLSGARVEIGQKHKPLIVDESGDLKLSKRVVPQPWFETYLSPDLRTLPLFGSIASFTQPGMRANRLLVEKVMDVFSRLEKGRVFELFSGLGNFTFPIASAGFEVVAFEVDPVAQWSFQETLQSVPEMESQIRFEQRNLYQGSKNPLTKQSFNILFVDPPRSGLKNVLDWLEEIAPEQRPVDLVYVSCFAESLAADLQRLKLLNYHCQSIEGVDQFPQASHCEWVVHLQR